MYITLRTYLKSIFYKTPVIWNLLESVQGLVFVWDFLYYYKLPGHQNRISTKELNIEFASQCNLRCKFCSLDHNKPKQLIKIETLEKIFQRIVDDKRFRSLKIINLHNGGEILLHPKRVELLKVIKRYKDIAKKRGIPFPQIYLLTNGMLLRDKLSKEIIETGAIDTIGFSLDGGTPEMFEEMRTNSKWDVIRKNIADFHRHNNASEHKIETYAICCLTDDKKLNTKWMEPSFRETLESLDRYELRKLHNWAGEVPDASKTKRKPHKIGCTLFMRQMVILPNGDITLCCNDLNSKGVVGNMLKDDIIAIHKSKERLYYLGRFMRGKKQDIPLCKGCETF